VKLFVGHPGQQECLTGFVEKTKDWKRELAWVGKDGLIVFDDVGFGREQDELRRAGFSVFGGNTESDRLEQERMFSNAVLAEAGFSIMPLYDFVRPQEAIEWILRHPRYWVVKQNTHQSALSYVGQMPNGRDVCSLLERYEREGIRNISLQERRTGIEIGIARYFNGHDWVGPIELNVEHKSLFPDDIGPKTGEMGTLMWYVDDEAQPLFLATLARLKKYLQSIDYRGDIDINVLVSEKTIYPIEITARLGCPSTHLHSILHVSPWHELLTAVAKGESYPLGTRLEYGVVLTQALPPFPYEGNIGKEYSSEGLEVLFRDGFTEADRHFLHFEGVRKTRYEDEERFFVTKSIGYTLFVSGFGGTIEAAREAALTRAGNVVIPRAFYRTDIGQRFAADGQRRLESWGWL
jgi:phosphoribosylamine---glycine ligase